MSTGGFSIICVVLQFLLISSVLGDCVLPAHPANVDCYTTTSDGLCGDSAAVTSPGGVLVIGSVVYVQCNTGFTPTIMGYSCFTILGTSSLAPTLGDSACARLCPDPGNPTLGSRGSEPTLDGTYYEQGDQVTFICDVNATTYGVDTFTCDNGDWYVGANIQTRLPPELCFLNCQKPEPPINGIEVDGASYVHAGSVEYECDSGITMAGSSTLTCYNGTWDNSVPLCGSVIITQVITTISNGQPVVPGEESVLSLLVDATSSSIGAGVSGTDLWSLNVFLSDSSSGAKQYNESTVMLTQADKDQDLAAGGAIKFNIDYAVTASSCAVATYACVELQQGPNTEFTLNGFDGDDSKLIGCSSVTCACFTPNSASLQRGVQTADASPFYSGDTLTMSCDGSDGYSLFGGPTLQCEDGMWSEDPYALHCSENCPNPGELTNGSVTCQDPEQCYAPLTQITISCDDGFLLHGTPTFTCMLNNSDFSVKWSPTLNFTTGVPSCLQSCQAPGTPDNGQLVEGTLPSTSGQTIRYACIEGYTASSSAALQCQEDGTWDKEVPVCYGNCAKNDETPRLEWVPSKDEYTHGEYIRFRCTDLAVFEGGEMVQCQNGTFVPSPPTCKETETSSATKTVVHMSCVFVIQTSIAMILSGYSA
ncbi:sushi, von Willebrand factor type A, EGF and pentraxin domain-containing protein 1-like [Saccoglossus kowalevskii]|uniref:CUB and sushi domain-containing protein 3-like n=1 Tax=Saccoglossus kowalevskii TaxID=10224 RepID=A0ABM0GT97_SACKO|nr:PREDICTED: CUB and sushi domain-containing protein 3-like [Saccoglossus kowalevskii]